MVECVGRPRLPDFGQEELLQVRFAAFTAGTAKRRPNLFAGLEAYAKN